MIATAAEVGATAPVQDDPAAASYGSSRARRIEARRRRRLRARRRALADRLGSDRPVFGRWARWNGRPWHERQEPDPEEAEAASEAFDRETDELLLEPRSRDLAGFGRLVLTELHILEVGLGGRRRFSEKGAQQVRLALPAFLYRLERYWDLRSDLLHWDLPGHTFAPKGDHRPEDLWTYRDVAKRLDLPAGTVLVVHPAEVGCGDWSSTAHRVESGKLHVDHFQRSCGRAGCSHRDHKTHFACWRKGWLGREVAAVETRTYWAKAVTCAKDEQLTHVVVSPTPNLHGPPRWTAHRTRRGYRKLRSDVEALVGFLGVRGYVLVPHPFRVSTGRWSPRHGCVEGVHFHLIGHGFLRKTPASGWGIVCGRCGHWEGDHREGGACDSEHHGARRRARSPDLDGFDGAPPGKARRPCRCSSFVARFDGWIVKNLRTRKSIPGSLRYLLSHAGIASKAAAPGPVSLPNCETPAQRQPVLTVTWGGDWSTAKLRVPKPVEEAVPVRLCRVCGRLVPEFEWFRVVHVGSGPPSHEPVEADESEWRAVTHNWYPENHGDRAPREEWGALRS